MSWRDKTLFTTARRAEAVRYPAPSRTWQPPNGDTQLVVCVAPNERTCLGCGETFVGEFCIRCGLRGDGTRREKLPPSVPTLAYLREGEYEEGR